MYLWARLCSCLPLGIFIAAHLSCCHSSNLVSGSSSLQEYPMFTAVSETEEREVGWAVGVGAQRGKQEMQRGQNTFLVPGQDPDFNPSLLEEVNRLRNPLLELVLDGRHAQELQNITDNL